MLHKTICERVGFLLFQRGLLLFFRIAQYYTTSAWLKHVLTWKEHSIRRALVVAEAERDAHIPILHHRDNRRKIKVEGRQRNAWWKINWSENGIHWANWQPISVSSSNYNILVLPCNLSLDGSNLPGRRSQLLPSKQINVATTLK